MIWTTSNCFDFYLLIGKTDVKSKITIKNEAVPQNAPVKEVSLCQVIVFSIVMGSESGQLINFYYLSGKVMTLGNSRIYTICYSYRKFRNVVNGLINWCKILFFIDSFC